MYMTIFVRNCAICTKTTASSINLNAHGLEMESEFSWLTSTHCFQTYLGFLSFSTDTFWLGHTITTSTFTTRTQRQTSCCKRTSQHSKLRKLEGKRTRDSIRKAELKEQTATRHPLMSIISISTRRYCMLLGIRKKTQSRLQLRTTCSYLPNQAQVRKELHQILQLALPNFLRM